MCLRAYELILRRGIATGRQTIGALVPVHRVVSNRLEGAAHWHLAPPTAAAGVVAGVEEVAASGEAVRCEDEGTGRVAFG